MSEKNISQEVLDKIKGSKPKPKWKFLLKEYLVWFLGIISLILGALAFSTILYMFLHNDWDIYESVSGSLLGFIFYNLPYFWLIFLAIFIYVAHYYIRHTKSGYKFQFYKIIISSVAISIIFGSFFYNFGVGQAIDNLVAAKVPFYGKFINPRQQIWLKTDKGLLAGIIVQGDGYSYTVRDINGNEWRVFIEDKDIPFEPSLGQPIRCLGEKIDDNTFEAHEILPMRGMIWIKKQPPIMIERNVKGVRIIR